MLWPVGYLQMCCLISKCLGFSRHLFLLFMSNLISLQSGAYSTWFQSSQIYWNLFYGSAYGLSWWTFPIHLEKIVYSKFYNCWSGQLVEVLSRTSMSLWIFCSFIIATRALKSYLQTQRRREMWSYCKFTYSNRCDLGTIADFHTNYSY